MYVATQIDEERLDRDSRLTNKKREESRAVSKGQQVARTILEQLGGQAKLRMMTGAKHFASYSPAGENKCGEGCGGVSFRFPKPQHKGSPNYCKVILNQLDTYDVTFGVIRKYEYTETKTLNNIYCDQLIETFESATGLYLTF